jgi:4-carboxymuconolactone decarboxylase
MTNPSQTNGPSRPVKISETARKNHDALFPNYPSSLCITDPELIEIFDNFAFDEVLAHTQMEPRTRILMILAALIGSQALSEYKIMAAAALHIGATPVEIKEILYQSVPYVGMGKAFDFILATNELLTSRDVPLPLPSQSTTSVETRYAKGLAIQKVVSGQRDNQGYAPLEDQLHIQRFISANCFGSYYTRTGLDIKHRELVTLSILIALGAMETLIKLHIQGNLNVGNDRSVLIDLMTQLLPWIGYPRTLYAFRCLNEVSPAQPLAKK